MGRLSREAGEAFQRFARRHLFPRAAVEVAVGTGKHRIDLIWRGMLVELKTSRRLYARELEQLDVFSKVARGTGMPLTYVFLRKPGKTTTETIQRAGGVVFYIFD
jgi:hypothetical protein